MSKNLEPLSFREFKSIWSLQADNEDYFLDSTHYGCHENEFYHWLKKQRMMVKRYSINQSSSLMDFQLPENKWFFFIDVFNRQMKTTFLVKQYPDGFFEAINNEGEVAAFLPDTYGKEPYRLSYYKSNGPIHHQTYATRLEALEHLANRMFVAKEGVLDSLIGTDQWNRGLYVCKWLSEGIHPMDGARNEQENPEVKRLFKHELAIAA
ncbi:hypothetical protein FG064_16545 [Vibrio cholerae]|uniref:hypothetical protein n=1 Tax=Vibrio cholerae TaxID=666 RepID=UPI0011D9E12C|nr:hypothetical protein [Vibrio cholerae]EGR0468607.1 hypothetical protein [Vibrio cholerae]TXY52014.1 hypothetical protein FXE74_18655 [Vibrio cholerae]GIB34702.1 hypothetical protein VCSRO91_3579 [Vibrio cholerae]